MNNNLLEGKNCRLVIGNDKEEYEVKGNVLYHPSFVRPVDVQYFSPKVSEISLEVDIEDNKIYEVAHAVISEVETEKVVFVGELSVIDNKIIIPDDLELSDDIKYCMQASVILNVELNVD